jgi:hypothetical protein
MMGSLLRRLIMLPIPPSYSGRALAIAILTAATVVLAKVHAFPGVLAAAAAATIVVFTVDALARQRRHAE